jgi:heme/copper-type cytochrome/quinol oxidase subunit 2
MNFSIKVLPQDQFDQYIAARQAALNAAHTTAAQGSAG